MIKLIKFIKPYIWLILALVIVTYFQVMANLKLPEYMALIVNEGILLKNIEVIYGHGWLMVLVTLVGAICAVIVGFLAARIATGFARDIRQEVFTKVESFSISEFNRFSTASLITRSTNDVQQIQMTLTMIFRLVLMAPIMAVGALQKALTTAPSMSWIIALATLLLLTMISVLVLFGLPKFKLVQELIDKLNLVTRENVSGLKVLRAFNNESKEETKFEKTNQELTRVNLFVNRLMSILQPAMNLVLNFAVIAIVWFAAHLIESGTLQIGEMLAFIQYTMQVIISFLMISIVFIMVPRAVVSGKRIVELIETEPLIKDPQAPIRPNSQGKGRVVFKDVTFTYPDAELPVLTDINFSAEPGQTTALIGSTGSGKTTLINLVLRFYDVTAGQILIDGVDIRDLKLEDLYHQIGYVPQKGVLFSGTVKSNISFGNKHLSDAEIKEAAGVAQATEFINKLDKKYDHEIAQGGANVSGGQKQKLSIARAIAVKPKIYFFDDSFSALDFKTDAKLRQHLTRKTKEQTTLIVGQRVSTIMNVDKIIVLDKGKIVGQGTHQELLKNNSVYQEIAYSQLSDEELKLQL
jgi:ATP-binding cassette subfamily B protein